MNADFLRNANEKTAFSVGFEIAACVAMHAPELLAAWYEALVRARVAMERTHQETSGGDVDSIAVWRERFRNADYADAMQFAGHCSQQGMFVELAGEG